MRISIITVTFNSAATLEDTLRSVASQTWPDIEHIIVDGASTDGTLDIVKQFTSEKVRLVSEPDRGIYDAMNKGIRLATGDFVGVLNSDDVFANQDTIAKLAKYLSSNPDLGGAYGDLVYVDRGDTGKITRFYTSKRFSPWNIRFGLTLPHPTLYVRPDIYRKFGFYKTNYRVAADFELIARIITRGVKLGRNPHVMVKMREGGISSTGFFWRVHQNLEIVRACKENGIYTNIFMVMLKLPFKLASYFKR